MIDATVAKGAPMLNRPSFAPRRRIARKLPEFQWRVIDFVCGRISEEQLACDVWRFLSDGLGHANECLFDWALVNETDEILIPGGEDEDNRFLVEVIGRETIDVAARLEGPMGACRRHRVRWLVWTDARRWHVAHVREETAVPRPFLTFDLLTPPSAELIDTLYLISYEGLLEDALSSYWFEATRCRAPAESAASR